MTGPKLNEATRVAGERSGTKAVGRYERSSASKVRVVLNLIRGKDVQTADEILKFTDREAARLVRKVLASAVANAQHNDEQDADDLYVKACFADEGPTLKRFRPRARGRAGKIHKKTCHITVVVERMSDEQMARRDAKTNARRGALSSRQARVAASRRRAADAAKSTGNESPETTTENESPAMETVEETTSSAPVEETTATETTEEASPADDAEGTEN
jgi:large subunit ribosomal protein L22